MLGLFLCDGSNEYAIHLAPSLRHHVITCKLRSDASDKTERMYLLKAI